MTQDEIIEMGVQAGLCDEFGDINFEYGYREEIIAFAKLVAAKEREALTPRCWTTEMNDAWNKAIPDLTLAFDKLIRARGESDT